MARGVESRPPMAALCRDPVAPATFSGTMPIYEYQCRACGHRFERLHRGGTATPAATAAACERCGKPADRQMSWFGVGGGAASDRSNADVGGNAPFCGRCGENRPPCGN